MRVDGTFWLNMGDCYAGSGKGRNADGTHSKGGKQDTNLGSLTGRKFPTQGLQKGGCASWATRQDRGCARVGFRPKDLVGQPWRLAFALQDSGWYLRQDVIWSKPNPMPESVSDRCTRSHEYIFMFTKRARYFYNADAIKNPPSDALIQQIDEGYNGLATKDFEGSGVQNASAVKSRIIEGMRKRIAKKRGAEQPHKGLSVKWDAMTRAEQMACGSNARSVWTMSTHGYKGAHFATFP